MTTDISHLLIEAAETGDGIFFLLPDNYARPSVSDDDQMAHTKALASAVREAHKFDISDVVPTFSPELAETAFDQNAEGELHAPFETCLFDFGTRPNGQRVIILTKDSGDIIAVRGLYFIHSRWQTLPYLVACFKGKPRAEAVFFDTAFPAIPIPKDFDLREDNFVALRACLEAVMSALVMMGSESIKLVAVKAPKFINKKRIARGEEPLNSYTTVTIDVDAVHRATERHGGTHASPRLHWRRGHKRHLPDGKTTWVRACLVGDPFAGTVSHDYALAGKTA